MNEKMKNKLKNVFYDENEEIISILGQGFLTNFLFSGSISRTILILTNRRLYREGKAYAPGALGKAQVSSAVNVEDVRATHFVDINHKGILILGIIIFLFSFTLPLFVRHDPGVLGASASVSFIGILFFILWLLGKKRLFIIEYVGGQIFVNCKWYGEEELRDFQKAINKIREKGSKKT